MINNIELKKIAQYIYEKTGIVYHEESFFQLEKRVNSFIDTYHVNEKIFLTTLTNSAELSLKFLESATNNESYFFRDPIVWDNLINTLKEISTTEKKSSLKGMFLGCSRGQELYTLAMIIHEKKKELKNLNFSFDAYDFNSSVLGQAKKGIYSQLEVSRGINGHRLETFFEHDINTPDVFEFKKSYKIPCEFHAFNLQKDKIPNARYDFIVCRNVLIYQDEIAKKKILNDIYLALQHGGVLLLGGSEKILITNLGNFKEKIINGVTFYFK